MSDLPLGQLITTPQQRDAIHVAVAPVMAAEAMEPGQHVQLNHEGMACSGKEPIGIVDPYLRNDVMPGEQFWLFLYPKTVTNLRHDWSHPAFDKKNEEINNKKQAEIWLTEFAMTWNMQFDYMISGAVHGEGITASGMDIHSWSELDDHGAEFWRQLEIYTGRTFDSEFRERVYISCSC